MPYTTANANLAAGYYRRRRGLLNGEQYRRPEEERNQPPMNPVTQPAAPTTEPQQPPATPSITPVSDRITDLLKTDSPYMQQAETQAKQQANRRGLLNSSIAVQAGQAARINAAFPIASQDAGIELENRIASMNLAAAERQQVGALTAAFESSYSNTLASIMSNPEIPAEERQRYMDHAARIRDSNLNLLEQFYGINLQWSTPS